MKLDATQYDIAQFDGRGDYPLWERQVMGALKASGLGKMLRAKPTDIPDED